MNTELVTAEIKPRSVEVECGNLRIEAAHDGGFCAGWSAKVLLDGKPICVKSLTLRIAVDEVVSATMAFYPGLPQEAQQYKIHPRSDSTTDAPTPNFREFL